MAEQSSNTEIRLSVDSNFLKELEKRTGVKRSTDLARVALSLLDWASEEAEGGRVILSTDSTGKDPHRLVMPELRKKAEAG